MVFGIGAFFFFFFLTADLSFFLLFSFCLKTAPIAYVH